MGFWAVSSSETQSNPGICNQICNQIRQHTLPSDCSLKSKHIADLPNFSSILSEKLNLAASSPIFKRLGDPFIRESEAESELEIEHTGSNVNYWRSPYINPNWRLNVCRNGAKLSDHFDGRYIKSVDCVSIYSIMVYEHTRECRSQM